MPFLLLLFLMLVCSPEHWDSPDLLGSGFEITDRSLETLEREATAFKTDDAERKTVLAKLDTLKGQKFASRDEFSRTLAGTLTKEEQDHFREMVLDNAQVVNPWRSFGLTFTTMILIVLAAALISYHINRGFAANPSQREKWGRRYTRLRFYHLLLLFAAYGTTLWSFGWGWVVQSFGNGAILFPCAEVLVLAPFLIALIGSWAFFYNAERALHGAEQSATAATSYWSRWAYISFHIRQNLALVFIPAGVLILSKPLLRSSVNPEVSGAIGLVLVLGLFAVIPWILRLVLGLKSMPANALRDRLLAAAQRLKFRCNDILIWNTRGGVANAMVAGVLPNLRYVILTDRLAADLTPDEVEAVFGHEVGHVKHHHMLYYMLFLILSLATMAAGAAMLLIYTQNPFFVLDERLASNLFQTLPKVAIFGAYIFVAFGFLSRRCERQADIYGCRTVSCSRHDCAGHEAEILPAKAAGLCPTGIRTFIQALEKVAVLNGISRDKPGWLQSWQHSTIARRVEFLQKVIINPAEERSFQRRVFLLKSAVFAGLGAILVANILLVYFWELGRSNQEKPQETTTARVEP